MINTLINAGAFLLRKLGITESPVTSGKRPSYIYMKRTMFVFAVVLCTWAIVEPESLAMRLEHASEVLPAWFTGLLLSVFSGVWI